MSQPPDIVSSDTRRTQRIPAGQVLTRKWPILHAGPTPGFDAATWDFRIFGLVTAPVRWNWAEFGVLPRVTVFADMHCVTTWSKLDNLWTGVRTREVLRHAQVDATAQFVLVHCEYGFTTNLPLADFLSDDCLFAFQHNGVDLDPDHGYPLRLVVPKLYAWKSAKWVRGIELLATDQPGFWESWRNGGYHLRGDPWVQNETHPDGERFR
jgi:DMSO/TMAO reductase YedYZ molybdopterin-dependent catalytic subunit